MVILKLSIYQYFDFTLGQIGIYQIGQSNLNALPLSAQPYYLDYIFNLNFAIILHKLKFILPFLFYYCYRTYNLIET